MTNQEETEKCVYWGTHPPPPVFLFPGGDKCSRQVQAHFCRKPWKEKRTSHPFTGQCLYKNGILILSIKIVYICLVLLFWFQLHIDFLPVRGIAIRDSESERNVTGSHLIFHPSFILNQWEWQSHRQRKMRLLQKQINLAHPPLFTSFITKLHVWPLFYKRNYVFFSVFSSRFFHRHLI